MWRRGGGGAPSSVVYRIFETEPFKAGLRKLDPSVRARLQCLPVRRVRAGRGVRGLVPVRRKTATGVRRWRPLPSLVPDGGRTALLAGLHPHGHARFHHRLVRARGAASDRGRRGPGLRAVRHLRGRSALHHRRPEPRCARPRAPQSAQLERDPAQPGAAAAVMALDARRGGTPVDVSSRSAVLPFVLVLDGVIHRRPGAATSRDETGESASSHVRIRAQPASTFPLKPMVSRPHGGVRS